MSFKLDSKLIFIIFPTIYLIYRCYGASSFETKCIINDEGICVFKNISTTVEQPYFYPTANNVLGITKIRFEISKIEALTNEMCEMFPQLQEILLEKVQLRKINEGALDTCVELRKLSLSGNKIESIPELSFKNNLKLKQLNFSNNLLKAFDPVVISNLTNLEILKISDNNISEIDMKKFVHLANLSNIHLGNNQITKLNMDEMILKFPQLKKLYLSGNPMYCDTLLRILAKSRKANIQIESFGGMRQSRKISSAKIENIECILRDFEINQIETSNLLLYITSVSAGLVILVLVVLLVHSICMRKIQMKQTDLHNVFRDFQAFYLVSSSTRPSLTKNYMNLHN